MDEIRHRYTDQKFSRWNPIVAQREYLIRRKIDDGKKVHLLLQSDDENKPLSKDLAIRMEEKAFEKDLIEISATVINK